VSFLPLIVLIGLSSACGDGDRKKGPADAGTDGSLSDAGDAGGGPVITAIWRLPGAEVDTFALPWPSDVHVGAGGLVDFSVLPNPSRNPTLREYLDLMSSELRGYGTNGAIYFRFDGDLDTGDFPRFDESIEPDSIVWLVDVTKGSPTHLERTPVRLRWQLEATTYWPERTLAVLPVHGFPLRPETTYACALTTGLRGAGGERVAADLDFEKVLAGGDDLHEPALVALAEAGLPREEVVSLAVFTTMDPVGEMFDAADWARSVPDAPVVEDMVYEDPGNNFYLFTGHYGPVPILQNGEAPYSDEGSGGFEFDASGDPILDHEVSVRFALSVPRVPAPAGGWPLVLYAHGTGGDFRSFVDDRTAEAMAARGMAAMGIDQVLHGEREGAGFGEGSLFFNYGNPLAGRDNNRQAAIDVVVQARLAREIAVPAAIHPDAIDVAIDPARIYFFGHSQGGLNGPLFLAVDDAARGAVLSGSAGIIAIALVEKEEPVSIPALVGLVLDVDTAAEGWDVFHPIATLVQTWTEPSDPVNYAPYIIREPRVGGGRSVCQTEGLEDLYATPNGIEALAIAIGLPIIHPAARPDAVGALSIRLDGLGIEPGPVTGNLHAGDGSDVTGGLLQYQFGDHFVVFDDEDARERTSDFLASLAGGGPGTIDAP